MNNAALLALPDDLLLQITTYLCYDDINAFKMCCCRMYQLSFCREVLKRCNLLVKPKSLTDNFMDFLKKLNECRYVSLSIESLDAKGINKILTEITKVPDIRLNILYLSNIVKNCVSITRMVLNDYKGNSFGMFDKMEEYITYFQPLERLNNLQELVLCGCNQVYSSEVLGVILSFLKSLQSLHLSTLTIACKQKPNELATALSKANHIKHWKFENLIFINKAGIKLPAETLSFICVNTIINPLSDQHVALKRLVIDGMIPYYAKYWKRNNFKNLEYLELNKAFFYRSNLAVSSKLRQIKLLDCHLSLNFLLNLSVVVENSLQVLTIRSYNGFDDKSILRLLAKFSNLKMLKLIDMNHVTNMFLCEVQHDHILEIVLQNCLQFRAKQRKEEIAAMDLNFRVKVLEHIITMQKKITDLSPEVFLKITNYLNFDEVLTLRLSCRTVYKLIMPAFLKRFSIRPILPRDTLKFVEFLKKMDNGKSLKVCLEKINDQSVQKVLPFLKNLHHLSIEIKHLRNVTKDCINLKKLTLFDLSIGDDFASSFNDFHIKAFKDLKTFTQLDELTLIGGMNIFSVDALAIFVKSAPPSVSTIELSSLRLSYDSTPHFWNGIPKGLKHWKFKDVLSLSKLNLIIPSSVLSLSMDSCDGIVQLADTTNPQLEKLTIYGKCSKWEPFASFNWSEINFNYLRFLHISRACDKFVHAWKESRCKLWDFVCLNSTVQETVIHLTISACTCGNDDVQRTIIRFYKIQHLTLIDMPNLSPSIIAKISNEYLDHISLRNCKQVPRGVVKHLSCSLPFKLTVY